MSKKPRNISTITRDFLYEAYCVEKLTVIQIARRVGCRNGIICKLLEEYGLREHTMPKEWFIEHYINLQESIDDIATLLNRDEATIRTWLRTYKIPIRYKTRGRIQIPELNDYQWLYHHYVELNLSSCQIAEILWCGQGNVIHAVRRAGIPVRPSSPPKGFHARGYRHNFSHRKKRLIKERDDYTCQMPGCDATSDLEVHHIISAENGGDNDLNNGITLCRTCHHKTFQHEEEFEFLFKTILATNKSGAARLVSTPLQLRMFT